MPFGSRSATPAAIFDGCIGLTAGRPRPAPGLDLGQQVPRAVQAAGVEGAGLGVGVALQVHLPSSPVGEAVPHVGVERRGVNALSGGLAA